MAKGPHRPSTRIILPNGLWLLIYDDGSGDVKLGGYDRTMTVTEVTSRDDGAAVYIRVTENAPTPRQTRPRATDLVPISRGQARVRSLLADPA